MNPYLSLIRGYFIAIKLNATSLTLLLLATDFLVKSSLRFINEGCVAVHMAFEMNGLAVHFNPLSYCES